MPLGIVLLNKTPKTAAFFSKFAPPGVVLLKQIAYRYSAEA